MNTYDDTESLYSGIYNDSGAFGTNVIGVAKEGHGVYGFNTASVDGAKIIGVSATNKAVLIDVQYNPLSLKNLTISAFTEDENSAVIFDKKTDADITLTFDSTFKLGAYCTNYNPVYIGMKSDGESGAISGNFSFGGDFYDGEKNLLVT